MQYSINGLITLVGLDDLESFNVQATKSSLNHSQHCYGFISYLQTLCSTILHNDKYFSCSAVQLLLIDVEYSLICKYSMNKYIG